MNYYFKPKNELKTKINFLIKVKKIEEYSVFLGLSYIQCCKNINSRNLQDYTLCAILLAGKYLNDYNYNIRDITDSLDINFTDYEKIELDILKELSWNLSKGIDTKDLIKCW